MLVSREQHAKNVEEYNRMLDEACFESAPPGGWFVLTPQVPILKWTTEKPTAPGLYWARFQGGRPYGCLIEISGLPDAGLDLTVSLTGSDDFGPIKEFDGYEWAGPIPLPQSHDEGDIPASQTYDQWIVERALQRED